MSQAEAAEHREEVQAVVTLAIAELVAQWPNLPLESPERVRDLLGDLLISLAEDFGTAAAGLGADWYDLLREDAGVRGGFDAVLPPLPPFEQIQASASYATSALYVDEQKALDQAAAITQRIVANADRAAIAESVRQDPAAPRWARIAQPDACAFCALLATRGADYRSEESAGGLANSYHDRCSCVAAPVWPDQPFVLPEYADPWLDTYDRARAELGSDDAKDFKLLLAKMRDLSSLR